MSKLYQHLQVSFLSLSWLLGGCFHPVHVLGEFSRENGVEKQSVLGNFQGAKKTHAEILKELEKAQIIYLGETHNSLTDHRAQLQIIQALFNKNPKIAIGLEMFQRPFQEVINQYLAGKLTETELIQQTEYEKRWGFPWEYYAPILRFAQAQNLPVVALNVPFEITRKVARQGLESLTLDEQKLIPPLSEIDLTNGQYRNFLQEIFGQHKSKKVGNSQGFERFFQSQVLWDETMAETVANFVKSHPDYQIVVLAGKGHLLYHYGIPDRVERRLKNFPLRNEGILQRSLLFINSHDSVFSDPEMADLFWYH